MITKKFEVSFGVLHFDWMKSSIEISKNVCCKYDQFKNYYSILRENLINK